MKINDTMKNVTSVKLGQGAVYVAMWLLRNHNKAIQENGGGKVENDTMMNALWKPCTMKLELKIHEVLVPVLYSEKVQKDHNHPKILQII